MLKEVHAVIQTYSEVRQRSQAHSSKCEVMASPAVSEDIYMWVLRSDLKRCCRAWSLEQDLASPWPTVVSARLLSGNQALCRALIVSRFVWEKAEFRGLALPCGHDEALESRPHPLAFNAVAVTWAVT
ncbi:hypothetical protein KOW79_000207 [Hemibagrus wyckioides]|uniref:Uncharacterized protein n=1 Tax=Hemibagrus wyckioides TaxID=337641 RepID=A0A9D3P7N3_9TELE|nr:hypothetical protein KOW79_000207 [Hemibagrus wyckioides]